MSKMADLDIVLSAYKLSDAQKNVVVGLLEGGATVAKTVTFKALERKGLVSQVDDVWQLNAEFKAELKATREPSFHEQLMDDVAQIEQGLNTNMWDAPVITEDEIDIFKEMADDVKKLAASQGIALTDEEANQVAQEDPNPWALGPETFNKDWAMWELELCGFEATIGWKNTDVWHGLTAQEIREDMNTALPIGRKARRERGRLVRKLTKSFELVGA